MSETPESKSPSSDEIIWELEGEARGFEPLDTGKPGFRLTGMREVQGTFEGKMENGFYAMTAPGPMEVYLYGPDPGLPWWKHWFYRIREAVRGTPYPTVVLASGPAEFSIDEEYEDGDDIIMTGSFTAAGEWDIKEVNR